MKRFRPIEPAPPNDGGVGALVGAVAFVLLVILAFHFLASYCQ